MTNRPHQRQKAAFGLSREIEDPFDLEAHLPYRIAVLSNLLIATRNPGVRAATDLPLRELRVLLNIGSYAPVRASDIAYQTRLDSFTVSRGVKELTDRGLVRLAADPADGRVSLLSLTETGAELYRRIIPSLEALGQALTSALEPDERAVLNDLLIRIEDRAEEVLASDALAQLAAGSTITTEEREIVRWYRRRRP